MSALEMVERVASAHLDAVRDLFKPGAKLTLLVRPQLGPEKDADFVLTDDALPAAIEALERRDAANRNSSPPSERRAMRRIPISAGRRIAVEYGYDQVAIYGRRCHDSAEPHGEHLTTYGITREHCAAAARIGDTLKRFMGWSV